MPRIARIIAPDFPHHVTQRGNNRATVFCDDEDRQTYLHLLDKYSKKFSLQIWAYCLMDNHVHLLAVPEKEESLARGVGLTNQVYTQYLNRKRNQSGRIWQNRFYSCLVDNDAYLWTVARYIESNPLKAGIADNAEGYHWSSAKAHVTGTDNSLLHTPCWLEPQHRESYGEFIRHVDDEADKAIRKATSTGRPFGSEAFIDNMEFRLNQTLRPRKPGRPRKVSG
ncbi:MAG: transposase [Thermodesulfobacteriota bacterium]|nr:transposase [Thermodesulfobacteriota bacterium]